MKVRPTRDGVAEAFERRRVALIMHEAVSQRYATPASPASCPDGAEVAAPSPLRLVCPSHYTVRTCSRTAHYLDRAKEADAVMAVAAECWRHDAFTALVEEDFRRLCGLAPAARPLGSPEDGRAQQGCGSASKSNVRPLTRPLVSRQDFCEMPPRWVMQSLGEVDRFAAADPAQWVARQHVTPLDVGATAVAPVSAQGCVEAAVPHVPRPAKTPRFRVRATAPMARGAYWVDLLPLADGQATSAAGDALRVDRAEVRLDPPVPLCVDALLPCDEFYSDRGVNTGAYVFFLRALQRQHEEQRGNGRLHRSTAAAVSSVVDPLHEEAAALALELSRCARRRRCELARRLRVLRDGDVPAAAAAAAAVPPGEIETGGPCRGAAAAGNGLAVVLQLRVDDARECLQLRAAVQSATARSNAERGKRPRDADESSGAPHHEGGVSDNGHATDAAELASESPTVEVLLRAAWKLAALYDMHHAVTATTRAEHAANDALDGAPRASAATPHVATALLTRLTARDDARGVAGDEGGRSGVAPRRASWTSMRLWHHDGAASFSAPLPALDGGGDGSAASAAAVTPDEQCFLARLFALLLRYRTLFGEHGYNQGPQAAVPPPVMEQLADTFAIGAEAFASPLNAQLPQFGSLFPDTDVHFGGLGSFFDVCFGGGAGAGAEAAEARDSGAVDGTALTERSGCHVEVNPPFDATLLRHMEAHLLACLQRARDAARSLLFLVVLPSHDLTDAERAAAAASPASTPPLSTSPSRQTPAAQRLHRDQLRSSGGPVAALTAAGSRTSTERVLRESPFCLGHVLCAAAESAYVDGHQHLLQSPFFCIETPTRLILLGNAAARRRFPDAAAQLEAVRQSWRTLTASALRSGS